MHVHVRKVNQWFINGTRYGSHYSPLKVRKQVDGARFGYHSRHGHGSSTWCIYPLDPEVQIKVLKIHSVLSSVGCLVFLAVFCASVLNSLSQ